MIHTSARHPSHLRLPVIATALAAVLASACGLHARDPERGSIKDHVSIKDDAPAHAARTPVPRLVKARANAGDVMLPRRRVSAERATPVEPRAAKTEIIAAPASETEIAAEAKPMAQLAKPAAVPVPRDVVTPKAADLPAPRPAIIAAVPIAKPADLRPTVEGRRGQPIETPVAAVAPPAPQPVAPSVISPAAAASAAPPPAVAAIIVPKASPAATVEAKPAPVVKPAPAAVAEPTVQAKVAALTPGERVRTTLERAQAHLKAGKLANARALLEDAGRSESSGEIMKALAETYDPLVLRQYPRLAQAGDPARAVMLYSDAVAKGSVAANDQLARLKEHLARR